MTADLERLKIDRDQARSGGGLRPAVWLVVVLVAAGALWAGLGEDGGSVTIQTARAVRLGAGAQAPAGSLTSNGYMVALREAGLTAKAAGRIAEFLVREGSVVEEGDLLVVLDRTELAAQREQARRELDQKRAEVGREDAGLSSSRASREEAEASLAEARANLAEAQALEVDARRDAERKQALLERGDISRSEAETAATEWEAARNRSLSADAALAAADRRVSAAASGVALAEANALASRAAVATYEARLGVLDAQWADHEVRAPFPGVVTAKTAEVGEIVSSMAVQGGQVGAGGILTLVDRASLVFEADVGETVITQVAVGQRARVTLDALPDAPRSGTVTDILPTSNRTKATVLVRVTLDGDDPRVLPEMGGRVAFMDEVPAAAGDEESTTGVWLPTGCLDRSGPEAAVWLLEDGRLRRVLITVGEERGGRVRVESGLQGGESCALEPAADWTNGMAAMSQDA